MFLILRYKDFINLILHINVIISYEVNGKIINIASIEKIIEHDKTWEKNTKKEMIINIEIRYLYDENKMLSGETIEKGKDIPEGKFYLTVVIWIQNSKGSFYYN